MSSKTEHMKIAVREALGDHASELCVRRTDDILEQADETRGSLSERSERVSAAVHRVAGVVPSAAIAKSTSRILDATPGS